MADRRLEGLALKVGPLGEHDRLLSLLSDAEGLTRFAVPGARRPKSSLAAAAPLTLLELQVGGRSGLGRVRQLRVLRSFSRLGQRLETLSAAQALCDLCLQLAADDPVNGLLSTVLLHSPAHPGRLRPPHAKLLSKWCTAGRTPRPMGLALQPVARGRIRHPFPTEFRHRAQPVGTGPSTATRTSRFATTAGWGTDGAPAGLAAVTTGR
jgi:hypothetical protein